MVIFHSYVTVYQRVSETSQWKSFTKKTWILHQHPASIHYIHYISLWKIKQKTTKKLKKPSIKSIQSYEKRYEKIHENPQIQLQTFWGNDLHKLWRSHQGALQRVSLRWVISFWKTKPRKISPFFLATAMVQWYGCGFFSMGQISFRFSIFSYILHVRSCHFHTRHPQNSVSDGQVPVLCSLCAWLGSSRRHVPSTNAARP